MPGPPGMLQPQPQPGTNNSATMPTARRMDVRVSRTYAGRGMVEVCERRRAKRSGERTRRRPKNQSLDGSARLGGGCKQRVAPTGQSPSGQDEWMSGVGIEG